MTLDRPTALSGLPTELRAFGTLVERPAGSCDDNTTTNDQGEAP